MMSLPEINSASPNGARKAPQIRIAKQFYRKNLFKRIFTYLIYTIFALILVYLCFAATIVRCIPSRSAGIIPVKNITDVGGVVKPNKIIIVNNNKAQGDSILSRLGQAIIPSDNVSVVKVIAGPYGKISWTNGFVKINNKSLNIKMPEIKDKNYLNNEYMVKCIKGACKANTYFIVSEKNVYGEPINHYKENN